MLVQKLLAAILLVGLGSSLSAREWTDSTGTFRVKAELLGMADRFSVILKRENGEKVTVPISRLSRSDRLYAKTTVGGWKFGEFLWATERMLDEVRSGDTTVQRQSLWEQRVPALCERYSGKPMTFNFEILDIKDSGRGYVLNLKLVIPDSADACNWSHFRLYSLRQYRMDLSEKEAEEIGDGSRLIINGSVEPELTSVVSHGGVMSYLAGIANNSPANTTSKWAVCLEDLAGTDADIALVLSRPTCRIEHPSLE